MFTVTESQDSDRNTVIYVMVEHPNGGTSEVVVSVDDNGKLNVGVDASSTAGCTISVNEIDIYDSESE